jgi:hypothetical protein
MSRINLIERRADINRHYEILLATIDYILEQLKSEDLSKTNLKNVVSHYNQEKLKVEKYFQLGNLGTLKNKLRVLIEYPMRKVDFNFNEYVKQRTGHSIDIFRILETRVEEVVMQNRISNNKQVGDIMIMLEVYKNRQDIEKAEILKNLLIKYYNKKN